MLRLLFQKCVDEIVKQEYVSIISKLCNLLYATSIKKYKKNKSEFLNNFAHFSR